MVLKSDGSGLYATKDLALARLKFDKFNIDTSIYIVDASQTLHFKQGQSGQTKNQSHQYTASHYVLIMYFCVLFCFVCFLGTVFKTLELMGYKKATNCVHIPYGQVVLPSGKMSSRTGTVIMFSQLCNMLDQDIYTKFLQKYDPDNAVDNNQDENSVPIVDVASASENKKVFTKQHRQDVKWTRSELSHAQHCISVATIKYGMLNHDVSKDIVFVLDEWTARTGNTGVYILYAYARIQNIICNVQVSQDSKVDYTLLTHESERSVLNLMHELWDAIEKSVEFKNPSTLCNFLFDLAKAFNSWYEIPTCSVNHAENANLKATRIEFIRNTSKVIQFGLKLLGIQTLDRM